MQAKAKIKMAILLFLLYGTLSPFRVVIYNLLIGGLSLWFFNRKAVKEEFAPLESPALSNGVY